MSCNICYESFNKSTRKPISCPLCNNIACLDCIKKYLLTCVVDFHCMYCKNKWNRETLITNLPKIFINNELRNHQELIIVNLEKARLPEAQLRAEERIKNIKRSEIKLLQNSLSSDFENNEYQQELLCIFAKNYGIDLNDTKLEDDKTKKKKEFIKNCPNNDCRGYIDTLNWSCGLCGVHVCSNCFEIKSEKGKHVCDQSIIESNKVIFKDSRQCPKCNTMIYKISGCNQMFCTQCYTAFDWETGNIVKGIIHNPHYFQWKINQEKNINHKNTSDIDIDYCDENINIDIEHLISNLYKLTSQCREFLPDFLRYFIHLREVIRVNYNNVLTSDLKMELNIKYIMGNISKSEWKKQLYEIDKRECMAREIIEIIDMGNIVSNERIKLIIKSKNKDEQNKYLKELNNLIDYIENQFENIKKNYMLKKSIIGDNEKHIILNRNIVKDI